MGFISKSSKLYKFCLEEAKWRVKEMSADYKGFETVEDYLVANSKDVQEFIDEYAYRLCDRCERWIDGEQIENMLNELVDDYELEKENTK